MQGQDADWDRALLAACPVQPWRGHVWRAHRRRYEATGWSGSLLVSARYHRAPDAFPPGQTWPALNLGLTYGICHAEINRHLTPALFAQLSDYRFSVLRVELARVIDCRDLSALHLSAGALFHDVDYHVGQDLAAAVRRLGAEGMLVPSATRFPDDILIVFPDLLQRGASMRIVQSVDPVLYVPRAGE